MDILIIEDDVVWRGQLQRMLEEYYNNANVTVARTLEEARVLLTLRVPDLVISDILLQDERSFQLFAASSRPYPVIFITSYAHHDFLNQSLSLPKTTFLVKPFHGLTLAAAINILLDNAKVAAPKAGKFIEVFGKFKQKQAIDLEDITYLEADGNYTKIHTKNRRTYAYKCPLRDVLVETDTRFLRVHKSFAINTTFVKRLDLSRSAVHVFEAVLPVGRAYRKNTIEVLAKILG